MNYPTWILTINMSPSVFAVVTAPVGKIIESGSFLLVRMAFELFDHVIFFGMLVVSAGIGLYCRLTGGRQKTNEEFLLANRKQNPICVAISLMASFMSAISIVSGTAEHYVYGTHFFTINVGNALGIICALSLFIPTFYKLKNVSVFQYLELRFGCATRLCASIITTVQMLLYISIALVAPAISLQTITNLSQEASILSCGLVCLFYAVLGGMKAIILTDVFQAVFMFASMFAVIFSGYSRVGSFSKIISTASERDRIDISNFSIDLTIRHSWWSTVIGGMFSSLYLNGINQTQVQRYLTMKNYKTVVIAALYSAPIVTALSFCVCVSGITLFAIYADCDPIRSQKISSGDQILPYYVANELHGYGLKGIFAAGVFSASLSTVSPVLNSLAAVTFEDYVMPLMKKFNSVKVEPKSSFFAQIFTFVYGIACIMISLLALRITSLLQAALTVFQLVGGPMLGIFSLGMFTSTANQKGTLFGFFVSLFSVAWLCLTPKPKPLALPTSTANCSARDLSNEEWLILNATTHISNESISGDEFSYITRVSYLYYGLIGFLITFVLGYTFSWIFGDKQSINMNLLHTAVAEPLLEEHPTSVRLKMVNEDFETHSAETSAKMLES